MKSFFLKYDQKIKLNLFQHCQVLGLGREVGGQNGEEELFLI